MVLSNSCVARRLWSCVWITEACISAVSCAFSKHFKRCMTKPELQLWCWRRTRPMWARQRERQQSRGSAVTASTARLRKQRRRQRSSRLFVLSGDVWQKDSFTVQLWDDKSRYCSEAGRHSLTSTPVFTKKVWAEKEKTEVSFWKLFFTDRRDFFSPPASTQSFPLHFCRAEPLKPSGVFEV